MKGQKQSRTDLLEKTVNAQNRIIEHLLNESNNMRDLAVGTLETLKSPSLASPLLVKNIFAHFRSLWQTVCLISIRTIKTHGCM